MKKTGVAPVRVALYGMTPRNHRNMELYLKGPCRGIAIVVDEMHAEVDLIDADFPTAGEILENRRRLTPNRPVILLSLQPLKIENALFIQKPVTATSLTTALNAVRPKAQPSSDTRHPASPAGNQGHEAKTPAPPKTEKLKQPDAPIRTVSKQQAALLDNEGGFTAFLGTLAEIDFSDHKQLLDAHYDQKKFFLGLAQSACKVAQHKNQPLQLNSIWKPILIFPDSQEIWLDADDKQLRVFAGMEQNKMSGNASLSPIDTQSSRDKLAKDKFQYMDAFIWKLAIWASKGRFPLGFDPDRPVFLKQWPNFTRLMITPDALRIAALLTQEPRTALEAAEILRVRPQYVFVFISACFSLGLLGQSERRAVATDAPELPKASKKKGLLSKILSKLRGE